LQNGQFVGRTDFGNAPIFSELMKGKIADPRGRQAFKYWIAINATDKFLMLAPDTPASVVAAYRDAFRRTVRDPEFIALGHKLSDEFSPMSYEDINMLISTLTATSPDVVDFLTTLLAKQGLTTGR
jgi:hypothetical protein